MDNKGIYIYGFVPSDCIKQIGMIIKKFGLYCIEYKDISAIVSDTKNEKIEYLNKEELAHMLVSHQKNIENIMNSGCVNIIPMQLGTVVSSGNDVIKILINGVSIYNEIFEIIEDFEEIDVAAVWNDFGGIIKNVSDSPQIKIMKEKIVGNNKYNEEDTIAIGKFIKEKIDQKNNKISNEVANSLMSFCGNAKKHETMNDEMPVNYAFLVRKESKEEFLEKINELDSKYENKLNFKIVGPLPCYSFYTIQTELIEKKDIENAKITLGIKLSENDYDLKKAYKNKVLLTHPDKDMELKNKNNDKFIEINSAYKLLLKCRNSVTKSSESISQYPLYIIKIKN